VANAATPKAAALMSALRRMPFNCTLPVATTVESGMGLFIAAPLHAESCATQHRGSLPTMRSYGRCFLVLYCSRFSTVRGSLLFEVQCFGEYRRAMLLGVH